VIRLTPARYVARFPDYPCDIRAVRVAFVAPLPSSPNLLLFSSVLGPNFSVFDEYLAANLDSHDSIIRVSTPLFPCPSLSQTDTCAIAV